MGVRFNRVDYSLRWWEESLVLSLPEREQGRMTTDNNRNKMSRLPVDDHQPVARTKHTELTLDQIGGLMPGLGSLMPISLPATELLRNRNRNKGRRPCAV